ncbi:hypothetical protein ABH920_009111 [Catenulispora sp. EB89]|uniref:hypothetical protein n=1 Tax=Catenulispora sp. EB89 TaxID=3156257 RepID=UPI003517825F
MVGADRSRDQGIGNAGPADRRTTLKTLYDAYVACPWSFCAVNAIVRTITAGGPVTDWDSDTGQGDQPQPVKPANVPALDRMLAWCNQRDDIRQVIRGAIVDLLVFGDAYLELVWVGNQPVALYNLDCPSIYPIADAHGHISGYVQVTEYGQRATFETREVIHIPQARSDQVSLRASRGSWRCATASWWRRIRISTFFAVVSRLESRIQAKIRVAGR